MSALEHLSEAERAELDQAVYASYGRMVLGAPPPEGSVTIAATDREDFRAQFYALFGTGEEHGGDTDQVRAAGSGDDPSPSS
ncbi:hypothetical protein [Halostreptopolyspora alba]|uniref:Uncharacterized protein n=1 Tax=Halostreptopolyspora alba TaxID=2487137 RepID=A0A3N0DYS1_9ACTN|nr:hypothetical protein EFW17_22520 [Nocardiopsaceae bacterium YIM 96095]